MTFKPTDTDVPPSIILKDILVAAGVGKFAQTTDSTNWGIFIAEEPAEPVNTVTIYDGLQPARLATQGAEEEDGEIWTPQTRVRATAYLDAYTKAKEVSNALNKFGRIETDYYTYNDILRNGAPFSIGKNQREQFIFVQNWKVYRMAKRRDN